MKRSVNFSRFLPRDGWHYLVLLLINQLIFLPISLIAPFSKNTVLYGDSFYFHYLISLFNADAYGIGSVPLWNPYICSGLPWAAGLDNKVFYLPELVLYWLGLFSYNSFQIEFVLTLFLAGLGVFILLRALRLDLLPSYLGAISYMSSGIFVASGSLFGQVIVYAYAPLVFFFLLRIHETNCLKYALGGAVTLALIITGGYAGTYLVLFYLLLIVSGIVFFRSEQKWKTFLNLSVFGLLGIGLAAIVVLPGWEFFSQMVRSQGLSYEIAVKGYALRPTDLLSAVFPSLASNKEFLSLINQPQPLMGNIYAGAITWVLAFWSFKAGRRKLCGLIAGLSLLCLLAALGDLTPVRPLTFYYVPMLDKIRLTSSVFRGFTLLGVSMLAAFGLQYLLSSRAGKQLGLLMLWPVVWVCAGLLIPQAEVFQKVLFTDFFWAIAILLGLGVTLYLQSKQKLGLTTAICIWLIILSFDAYRAVSTNSKWLWLIHPQSRASINQDEATRDALFSNLQHSKRKKTDGSMESYYCNLEPLFWRNRVDNGYMGGDDGAKLGAAEGFQRTKAGKLLTSGQGMFLMEELRYVKDAAALESALNSDIDFTKTAYVVDPSRAGTVERFSPHPNDVVGVKEFKLNEIQFNYQIEQEQLLVWNEIYYPGWKAYAEQAGREIPVFAVNGALRAMRLPKGGDGVRMRFEPGSFARGSAITYSSIFILVALSISAWRGGRKSGAIGMGAPSASQA